MNTRVIHPADQICTILKRIYDGDMTTLTGGNLSMRDDEGVVWVSPTGIDKSSLTREDIVRILPDGSIEGRHKPTSEYRIHWQILKRRPDLRAVLHAHPPALVAMSAAHEVPDSRLLYPTYEAVGIPELAEYGMPGTLKLVECVVEAFDRGCQAAVLKNHGVFLGSGQDLFDAFLRFEQMDFHARTEFLSGVLGKAKRAEESAVSRLAWKLQEEREKGAAQARLVRTGYSSRELSLRRELAEISRRAYRKRLFTGGFGTVSARVGEDEFLISPRWKDNAYLSEEDFVLVRKGEGEAGKEPDVFAGLHRRIYEENADIQSVMMASPVYASAYAVTEKEYEVGVIPESYGVLRDCRRIPLEEMIDGWDKIARGSGGEHPFCILENLGILVMGASVLLAFDKLEVAEGTAMSVHMADVGGRRMKVMTEDMKREQDGQDE